MISNGRKRLRIKDIAEMTNTSVATVSRVLNGLPGVGDEKRSQILEVVQRTGYVPLTAARTLSTRKAANLLIATPDPADYGYAQTILAANEITSAYGVGMSIVVLPPVEAHAAQVASVTKELLAHRDAPLLFIDYLPQADRILMKLLETVPAEDIAVLVRSRAQSDILHATYPDLTVFWVDEYYAARIATEYLLDLGHTKIGHISVPGTFGTKERDNGWRDLMVERGLSIPFDVPASWDTRSGYDAMQRVQNLHDATAIFCDSDALALGTIRHLSEQGIRVPQDISVMGLDDRPDTEFYRPSLATIHMDFLEFGRTVTRYLFGEIEGNSPEEADTRLRDSMMVMKRESAISVR